MKLLAQDHSLTDFSNRLDQFKLMQNPLLKFRSRWTRQDEPALSWPKLPDLPPVKEIPKAKIRQHLSYKTPAMVVTLESTDSGFLEAQREKLEALPFRPAWVNGQALPEPVPESRDKDTSPESGVGEELAPKRPRLKLKVAKAPEPIIEKEIDFEKLLQIAQEVKSSEFAQVIMDRIIMGTSPVDKLLLSAYFGERGFGKAGLTAAHLEAITKALGMGMTQREIYRLLMRYNALFGIENSLEVMHDGSPPRYRLTMQGLKKFRKVLNLGKFELPSFD